MNSLEARKEVWGIGPKDKTNHGHFRRLTDNWRKRDFAPVNRKAERARERRAEHPEIPKCRRRDRQKRREFQLNRAIGKLFDGECTPEEITYILRQCRNGDHDLIGVIGSNTGEEKEPFTRDIIFWYNG